MTANSLDAMQKQISLLLTSVNSVSKSVQTFNVRLSQLETKYEEQSRGSKRHIIPTIGGMRDRRGRCLEDRVNYLEDLCCSLYEDNQQLALNVKLMSGANEYNEMPGQNGRKTTERRSDAEEESRGLGGYSAGNQAEETVDAEFQSRGANQTYTLLSCEETITHAHHSHLYSLHDDQNYQLRESVWEAISLVFHPVFGCAGSLYMVVCLIINFFAQAFICYVVGSSFSQSPYPTIASVDRWRTNDGHDARNADVLTGVSLVSRVCQGDGSLGIASGQHIMLQEIRQYTGRFGFFMQNAYSVGPKLCMLAIWYWTLIILNEFRLLTVFILSLKDHVSYHTLISWSGKDFLLKSISRKRFGVIAFFSMLRAAIALLLLLSGSLWLSQTKNVQGLVLNTSALSFVLDVDEVIFATLAPHPTKVLMRSLQPISHTKLEFWDGISTASVVNILASISYVIMFAFLFVWPSVEGMLAIEKALCDGNQDFIYGVQSSTGLMYTSLSNAFTNNPDASYSSFKEEAIHRIVQGEDPRDISGTSFATEASLGFKMDQSMSEYGAYWSLCLDFPTPWPATVGFALEMSTKIQGRSCKDLKSKCTDEEQRFLRLICPETCGCASPVSGLMLSSQADGCPRQSCRASKSYREALEQLPCTDMSAEELSASEAWLAYFAQFESFWNAQFPDFKETTHKLYDELRTKGCKGMAADYMDDLCSEGLAFQSIRAFCPETCGCVGMSSSDSNFVNCPASCSSTDSGE